jgi:outer membrane translocation and assembly module TamA
MPKVFLLLLLIPAFTQAQRSFSLVVIPEGKDSSFLSRDFSYRNTFGDTSARQKELGLLLNKLNSGGYLEAGYSSFSYDVNRLTARLTIGALWEWATLQNGNVDEVILNRIGFKERLYENRPFEPMQITRLTESILDYCENNGYPFASVRLDSFSVSEQKLSGKIFLDKNKLVTIDSLGIVGDAKIAKVYLANYLGFRFPSIYREDVISRISSKLRELPFCAETKPPQVLFNADHSAITLFLNKKNASRFDFILGVLPNSSSTGKLLITGEGQLNMVNPFGRGESVFLSFSQLPPRTTQAELRAEYPYLFNMPFGIDGDFSLYKNDTLYIDVKEQIGLKYLFTGVNYFRFYFRNASSSMLNFDSAQVITSKQLPSYLDYQTQYYGLEYRLEKLDYRFNPSRGWNLSLSAEAGNRKVKENTAIIQLQDPANPEFDFSSLYDSVAAKEAQYLFRTTLLRYWSLTQRSVVMAGYRGAVLISNDILQNELFRIGGFQLLRGFDEQSIYASQYHVATLEYHYLLSQNSFFFIFTEGAFVQNQLASDENDYPYSFGAGLNFETKAGIFTMSYAVGAQQNNPVQFRSAKIHFGYVNYF